MAERLLILNAADLEDPRPTCEAIRGHLARLPQRPGGPRRFDLEGWAIQIHGAACTPCGAGMDGRPRELERASEARDALHALQKCAQKLGPRADLYLMSGGPGAIGREELLERIEEALRRLPVDRGRPPGRGRDCAIAVARAYHDVTGEMPPISSGYGGHRIPYHVAMEAIFAEHGFDGWAERVAEAAGALRIEEHKWPEIFCISAVRQGWL